VSSVSGFGVHYGPCRARGTADGCLLSTKVGKFRLDEGAADRTCRARAHRTDKTADILELGCSPQVDVFRRRRCPV
jgi:hypothetical protein